LALSLASSLLVSSSSSTSNVPTLFEIFKVQLLTSNSRSFTFSPLRAFAGIGFYYVALAALRVAQACASVGQPHRSFIHTKRPILQTSRNPSRR
jgi:hypothetical protein